MRSAAATLSLLALAVAGAFAQAPGERFDVVSIKRNTSGAPNSTLRPEPNGLTGINVTVLRLFRVAFQVVDFQIADAPGWFDSERYDVNARATGPVSVVTLAPMIRALLADRFGLRVEKTTREIPSFELRVERGGAAGLKPSTDPCSLARGGPAPSAERRSAGRPCFRTAAGEMIANGVPMEMVARELTALVRQPVVDRTELAGVFDFELRWAPDDSPPGSSDAPPLVTAIREQLGLRFVPARTPTDVYVIADAHRPDEN